MSSWKYAKEMDTTSYIFAHQPNKPYPNVHELSKCNISIDVFSNKIEYRHIGAENWVYDCMRVGRQRNWRADL